MFVNVVHGDCVQKIQEFINDPNFPRVHCTFFDPPFNQDKFYAESTDNLPEEEYWEWLTEILRKIFSLTIEGGSIYFMQREKNTGRVLRALEEAGWTYQNLIVWKKLTSAVPGKFRFGKQFQIIAFYTKGKKPHVFHRLRIDPPLLMTHKHSRRNGAFLTDIWDDIRELTSGYFAGEEPLRNLEGKRLHNQQSPVRLLLRVILSSSKPGDHIFDPFGGTGTTAVVAKQLRRNSTTIELAEINIEAIKTRTNEIRPVDDIRQYCGEYVFSEELDEIWGEPISKIARNQFHPQITLSQLEKALEKELDLKGLKKRLKEQVKVEFFSSEEDSC